MWVCVCVCVEELVTALFLLPSNSICFFHHFERLGCNVSLFESYWFIVVTFSTVGFGDVVPSHWSGQLVVTIFIIIALIYLPPKVSVHSCVRTQKYMLSVVH